MDSSETHILIPEQLLTNESEQVRIVLALFFNREKRIMGSLWGKFIIHIHRLLKLFPQGATLGEGGEYIFSVASWV